MAGPEDKLPPVARRENHKTLSVSQTITADESNATFQANTKAEACVADAVIQNSPGTAYLTHQWSGEYKAKFKDPKTGEAVEISARDDVGRVIEVWAQVETVPGTLDQLPAYREMHRSKDERIGEVSEGTLRGSQASIKRADAVATQIRGCMNSATEPSRALKKPFFTP